MEHKILGLHHVTAIASDAQTNLDFYKNIVGLRFVKKTINFDDPSVYHFYFGNQNAEPGSILTFFPWKGIMPGRRGAGQATETQFSVSPNSFAFWLEWLKKNNVTYNNPAKRFDEEYLTFLDPDGLKLELVSSPDQDNRTPANHPVIPAANGIKGFKGITLTVENYQRTSGILTDIFGYKLIGQEVNRYRFKIDTNPTASVVDIVDLPVGQRGHVAGGSVHHVAFRVADEETQMYYRNKLADMGYQITEQIDRDYFKAVYFREPGGVLFEISTNPPGFTVDEKFEELGTALKLPQWLEVRRTEIEKLLASLH